MESEANPFEYHYVLCDDNLPVEESLKEETKTVAEEGESTEEISKLSESVKDEECKESSTCDDENDIGLTEKNKNNSNVDNGSNMLPEDSEHSLPEVDCSEKQDVSDVQTTENDYGDVQVKVIDIPDDDDLFDFLQESKKAKEDELKKTELYKYLTEENRMNPQSEEVTPYHSGEEQPENQSQYMISSSDSESGSSSDESEENTETKTESISRRKTKQTPLQDEEEKTSTIRVRRRPERKPEVKAPQTKKVSTAQPKALTRTTLDRLEKSKEVTNQWLKDLSIPENLTFSQPLRMKIGELNQYLTCGLCKGYLYEASTITECMHTFCKNCIVRHCMEVSLHCPVCSILIHPTDPFVNIRLDRMIQDIVYKILPKVADTEMRRIEQFYAEHPEVEPKEMQQPPPPTKQVSPKEPKVQEQSTIPCSVVSLLLEAEEQYESQEVLEKKFVRVSGRATVDNVCEFLKKKLSLEDNYAVELFCCGDAVEETKCTLDTIKQNFFGDQEELMLLQYRIRQT